MFVSCSGAAEELTPKVAVVKLRFVDVSRSETRTVQQAIHEALTFLKIDWVSDAMIGDTEKRSKELLTDECFADEQNFSG
jgi:hypothetical protein